MNYCVIEKSQIMFYDTMKTNVEIDLKLGDTAMNTRNVYQCLGHIIYDDMFGEGEENTL